MYSSATNPLFQIDINIYGIHVCVHHFLFHIESSSSLRISVHRTTIQNITQMAELISLEMLRKKSSIIKLYEKKELIAVHGVNEILEDRMRKELGNRLQCAHQMFMKIVLRMLRDIIWNVVCSMQSRI